MKPHNLSHSQITNEQPNDTPKNAPLISVIEATRKGHNLTQSLVHSYYLCVLGNGGKLVSLDLFPHFEPFIRSYFVFQLQLAMGGSS